MKKFSTTVIALLIGISAFSQEEFRRNEIRLNLLPTLIFIYPEITYERALNENFSAGLSAGISPWEHPALREFSIIPFGRFYFGEQPARGFFIEANAALFAPENSFFRIGCDCHLYTAEGGRPDRHDFYIGAGVAAGWKILTRNNWVWDIMIGVGRGTNDSVYQRFGVSLGRRF
jgi:hypothetical protein